MADSVLLIVFKRDYENLRYLSRPVQRLLSELYFHA